MISMSITPATYDLTDIQQGADYEVTIQFVGVNLTGCTVASQVWNEEKTTQYAAFSIAYTNRASGIVSMSLTDNQTLLLPSTARYDVLVIDPGGLKTFYIEGAVYSNKSYTTV